MSVCLTLLPMAMSFIDLMLFSAIYGLFDGAFNAYILPVVATTVPARHVGLALGAMYTVISVELLFGAPLAGKIHHPFKFFF